MESRPIGIWMEAKILKLRRNRKKEIFGFPLLVRQDFSKKSVLTEESGKNFSHPPTPFCAPEWAALIRPRSGGSRGDQGLSFFFSEPLKRNSNSNFPEIRYSGKNLIIEEFSNFSFVLGFLDPRSNLFPTEDHEGVRIGSGGNPNIRNRRFSRE